MTMQNLNATGTMIHTPNYRVFLIEKYGAPARRTITKRIQAQLISRVVEMLLFLTLVLLVFSNQPVQAGNPQILPYCQPQSLSTSCLSIVCVCNATFCDELESPGVLGYDEVQLYTSSEDGDRVLRTTLSFDTAATSSNRIHIETEIRHQQIVGFGSTFSDAAAITVSSLSSGAKKNAIDAYFSPKGAEYTLGRLPMGGTDFSLREYSYDDVAGDFGLEQFLLADEDIKYKIPLIKAAQAVSNIDINLFGSPWLTPSWMREIVNGEMMLKGAPNGQYYETWAKYYTKFVEAYAARSVDIWGLSVQNEPNAGFGRLANLPNLTMAYTPKLQRDFIKLNLGPVLKSTNATKDIKLIVMDDQRDAASVWADTIFGDTEASRYSDGIGVQWYSDSAFSTATLGTIHKNYPKKFILGTEAGFSFDKDNIGCWDRAEQYAFDIINDMNKFITGWVDLNLFVDNVGGPNRVGLTSDAAIIVDSSKDQIYKQPMFYIMAHFSKFIRPGAHRVQMQMPGGAYGTAFVNAWGQRALVVLNRAKSGVTSFSISDSSKPGKFLNVKMKPRSIFTAVWDK
ncbi:hypothetical protein Y032_0006g3002 [Ancylostoma ceylanicum]|nr:hypothetical protein Y032_0006g3002 [Ancylostoma ceylanicum]